MLLFKKLKSQTGALFGMDARITLAIFSGLSVIAGTAGYGYIQQTQVTALATELCDDLLQGGVEDLHFYTLNRPELTRDVCHALGITPKLRLQNVA